VILAALALLAVALGGLALIEYRDRRRIRRTWQRMKLGFGRDMTPETVESMLAVLAGLSPGRAVALSVEATRARIDHYLETDQATADNLRSTLPALLPSLRLQPTDDEPTIGYGMGRAIRRRGRLRALRADEPARLSRTVLGSMQPLGTDERLTLRWLAPVGRVPCRAPRATRHPRPTIVASSRSRTTAPW
jgi:hypothetical protein